MLSFVPIRLDAEDSHADVPVRHAHTLGPESVPLSGEIVAEQGQIRCRRANTEAAAIALQVDLGEHELEAVSRVLADHEITDLPELRPLGSITLQTCLLPERVRPYVLSLELARHQIMLCLNKLEQWQLFASAPESILHELEVARHLFTEALVHQPGRDETQWDDSTTQRTALAALWLAIDAGERLALHHAATQFGPRTRGEIYAEAASSLGVVPSKGNAPAVLMPDRIGVASPGRPLLGAAVSPDRFGDADKAVLAESADFIQVPMRWVDMEPNEGSYDFAATDRWIEWAVRVAKLPVAAGPLVDFRANSTPEWLYIWENDYETLGELVREHVKALVTRYRRTVTRWTVVGGLQVNDNIRLGFEQMLDLSRVAVNIVRKLHPAARVLVEIDQPFGEYHTHNERSLPPMLFAEMLNQAGVNVDGYGLRVQLGGAASGQGTRDLLAFSDLLDRYAALERPISLTAVGCPSNIPPSLQAEKYAAVAPGCWRGEWTEAAQADWLTAALTIAASKPFIQAVCWQQVGDRTRRPEMPAGGLVGPEETPKAAANALRDIRDALKEGNVPSRIEDATVLSRTASG